MEYVIDGAKFNSEKGFFNYIERHFTRGLNFKIGRNLDAFSDILYGGFGVHDYGEQITIKWKNLNKSRDKLNNRFLGEVLEIIDEQDHITFMKYDYTIKD